MIAPCKCHGAASRPYETHRWFKRRVLLTIHLQYAESPVVKRIYASTRTLDRVGRCRRYYGSPGGARVWRQRPRSQGSSEQIVTLQIKSPYQRVGIVAAFKASEQEVLVGRHEDNARAVMKSSQYPFQCARFPHPVA